MPANQPKPSPSVRTTLYRLTQVTHLEDAVQDKYFSKGFTSTQVTVGGRDGLLVLGTMQTATVTWGTTLHALTGEQVALGNNTAAGVLLLEATATTPAGADAGVVWALTYGMGFQLIDQAKVDPGFGQRVAVRTADPQELSSMTRTALDQRSRTERSSIPGGDDLRGFGAGDFGELVTRLVAKATISGLTVGSTPLRIKGADALSVPLARDPAKLITDLDVLAEVLAEKPRPELELLEQLVALKTKDAVVADLRTELEKALGSPMPSAWDCHGRTSASATTSNRGRSACATPGPGTPTQSTAPPSWSTCSAHSPRCPKASASNASKR